MPGDSGLALHTGGALMRAKALDYLLQFSFFSIPFDVVAHVAGVRMTVCEVLFSLLFLVWLIDLMQGRSFTIDKRLLAAFGLFLVLSSVSIIEARNKFVSLRELVQYGWLFSVLIMLANVLTTRRQVVRTVVTLSIATAVASLAGLYEYFFLCEPHHQLIAATRLRASGFFDQPNAFGGYLAGVLPLLTLSCMSGTDDKAREGPFGILKSGPLRVLIVFVSSMALVATFSRGSWIGLAVALLVVLALGKGGQKWKTLKMYAMTLSVSAVIIVGDFLLQPSLEDDRSFSSRQRVLLLGTALQMFEDSPVIGVGIGNFPVWLEHYADDALNETLYWDYNPAEKKYYVNPDKVPDVELVHNFPLQVAAETGVLGLGGLLVVFFVYYRRVRSQLSECADSFIHDVRISGLAGVGAILAAGMFGWPFTHGVQEVLITCMALTLAPIPSDP